MRLPKPTDTVPIGALVRTSSVDFPNRIAVALFLHGCNLRCPYCYNSDLVTGSVYDYDSVTFAELAEHLEKRRNVISGFVISGGEPTISPYIVPLIRMAKEKGYAIKLDTNGMRPDILARIIANPETKPDFIALDIKTSPDRYSEMAAHIDGAEKLKQSVALLCTSGVAHEFRSVLVPGLIGKEDIAALAPLLSKKSSWQFSRFKAEQSCLSPAYRTKTPYTDAEIAMLLVYAQTFIDTVRLR